MVASEVESIRFGRSAISAVRANPGSDRDVNVRQLAGGMRIDQAAKNDQLSGRDQNQNQHGGEVQSFHESL